MTLRGFVLALVLLVPTMARAEPITVGGRGRRCYPDEWRLTRSSIGFRPFWLAGVSWDGLNTWRQLSPRRLRRGQSRVPQRWQRELYVLPLRRGHLRLDEDRRHHQLVERRHWDDVRTARSPMTPAPATTRTHGTIRVSSRSFAWWVPSRPITSSASRTSRSVSSTTIATTTTTWSKFETHSVPEPGTLLLLSGGMVALAARRKLTARKARSVATV